MSSRDWFALGARLLGLWVLYEAFSNLLYLGSSVMGFTPESAFKELNDTHTRQMYYLWYFLGYSAAAIYLLRGAEHLTRWVYREPSPNRDSDGDGSPE